MDGRLAELKLKVTYHDPCHLGQGISAEPRKLLKMIPGVEFVEMNEANWCCGGQALYDDPLRASMAYWTKMANAAATNADVIASGCPVCQMQLSYGVKRVKLPMKVTHPIALGIPLK